VDRIPLVPLDSDSRDVRPLRLAASGKCRCRRRFCWHMRECRSSGNVRILRSNIAGEDSNSWVVLCRECAAPTHRKRSA
jgi:hypothetical protein